MALFYTYPEVRFDIAYEVGVLSRSLENPTITDIGHVKRLLRYLAGTIDLKLTFKCQPGQFVLECYRDVHFAGCNRTSRSTSGIVLKLAGAAISWSSCRQTLVANSTCEAELVAANAACKDVIWMSRLLDE